MKFAKFLGFYLLLLTLFASCHKDKEETTLIDVEIPGPSIITLFEGDLQVYVTDVNGNPMEGVRVFVYDEQTETNKWGIAEFTSIPLDANGTFVRALKENFFFGSDKFYPAGTNNFTTIRMLPIENGKTFNPSSSVSIEIDGGGQIKFQANSIIDEVGNTFSGEVTVYSQRIATNDPHLDEIMPGALLGIDEKNRTVVLGTYGMIAVELRDANNNELNLDPNLPATVHFPITEDLQGLAPAEIPLWSFNESVGNWEEEGSANLINNEYVGLVSHFSFWNCDAPFDIINMEGTVLFEGGAPLIGARVQISTGPLVGFGYTNSEGVFSGKVPKDEVLTIEITPVGCTDVLYVADIGPFSDNVILDDIILSEIPTTVAGSVTCSGNEFGDALVYLQFPGKIYEFETTPNGIFSFNVTELLCQGVPGTIFAIDPATNQASPSMEIPSVDGEDFVLDVCSSCDFDYMFNSTEIDACEHDASVSLSISNGSGDYSYTWSTGESDQDAIVTESQFLCVTITDNIAECDATYCENISILENLGVDLFATFIDCEGQGLITSIPTNGVEPYSFLWVGPNGFTSTAQDIDIFDEGTYTLTVTDGNNCTAAATIEAFSNGGTYQLDLYSSAELICQGEFVTIDAFCGCGLDMNDVIWTLPDGSNQFGQVVTSDLIGLYYAELNGAICYAFGEIVIELEEDPDVNVEMICDNAFDRIYASLDGLPSQFTDPQFFIGDSSLIVNFQNLFTGNIELESNSTACVYEVPYSIPTYTNGLVILEINEATCSDCEDGYAVIEDVGGICDGCDYDTYYIYKSEELGIDVRNLNESNNLGTGLYYLVGKSLEGCIVYSQSFEL